MDEVKIRTLLGAMIAQGYSDTDILSALEKYEIPEPIEWLRKFYSSWGAQATNVGRQPGSILQWHIQMRHEILKKALMCEDLRVALATVDSMATLHGVTGKDSSDRDIPLQVTLVPRSVQ